MGLALCWESLQSMKGGLADVNFAAEKSGKFGEQIMLDALDVIKSMNFDFGNSF